MVLSAARAIAAMGLGLSCASCASCGAPQIPAQSADVTLVDARDAPVDLLQKARAARLTVLVFFSPHCRCLEVHEARLRALASGYAGRGVAFAMVDSETGSTARGDAAEAARRGYPFPILVDPGGRLAGRLGARYATYTVVLDAGGRVRYRGGIDNDKTHLTPDATPYLTNALDDLLAGRDPTVPETKTLGCALQTW